MKIIGVTLYRVSADLNDRKFSYELGSIVRINSNIMLKMPNRERALYLKEINHIQSFEYFIVRALITRYIRLIQMNIQE